MKRKIFGFSLVELVVSLVVIGCVLAITTPMMVKKAKTSSIPITAGGNLSTSCSDISDDCSLCKGKTCYVCSIVCDEGKYKDTDSCTCIDCPDNCSTCSSSGCSECNDGYYLNGSICTICPEGHYCINGNTSECAKGKYQSSTGQTSCDDCDDGYYANTKGSSSCTSCSLPLSTNANCISCNKTTGKCTKCENGYHLTDSNTCDNCSAGYSCDGSTTQTPCAEGSYSLGGVVTSCISCSLPASTHANCLACSASSGTCTYCASGYYLTSSKTCEPCPEGSVCDGGAVYTTSCDSSCKSCDTTTGTCSKCASGYYLSANTCQKCKAGYSCDGSSTQTPCKAGYYSTSGASSCTKCSLSDNCSTCDSTTGECTACADGYNLSNGSCVSDKWCTPANGLVNIGSLCVTQYNIGDHSNYPIPSAAGVTVKSATSSTSGNTWDAACSTPLCWQATGGVNTADENYCDSANGSYSGCKRTVCNWCAATAICDNLSITINGTTYSSWRVPTTSELASFTPATYSLSTSSSYAGDNGLMLCDYNSGHGSAQCRCGNHCSGSLGGYCYPRFVWSSKRYSSYSAYNYRLISGSWESGYDMEAFAYSVRCVHDL